MFMAETYTSTLITTTCWCGIHVAIPQSLYNEATQNHKQAVYCPLGHTFVYGGDTEAQRLKRSLRYANDRVAALGAEKDQVEASLRATKGHVTRLRKSVLAGECPFCHQNLRDLKRHIERKHSGENPEVEG